jgi:hypothetical protein
MSARREVSELGRPTNYVTDDGQKLRNKQIACGLAPAIHTCQANVFEFVSVRWIAIESCSLNLSKDIVPGRKSAGNLEGISF